jgi:Retinitis pigmentosa G-protein regulator interacting C-terminal
VVFSVVHEPPAGGDAECIDLGVARLDMHSIPHGMREVEVWTPDHSLRIATLEVEVSGLKDVMTALG